MAHKIANYLYNRLPEIYRIKDAEVNYDLRNFLEVLGGDVDPTLSNAKTGLELIKDETTGIINLTDMDKCPDKYLNSFGELFGFPNDLGLPPDMYRKLLGSIIYMYQRKSTEDIILYAGRLASGLQVSLTEIGKSVEHGNRNEYEVRFLAPSEDSRLLVREETLKRILEYLRPITDWFTYIKSFFYLDARVLGYTESNFSTKVSEVWTEVNLSPNVLTLNGENYFNTTGDSPLMLGRIFMFSDE